METANEPRSEFRLAVTGHSLVVIETAGEQELVHAFRSPVDAIKFFEDCCGPMTQAKVDEFLRQTSTWIG
jgi:hypothetical protein